MPLDMQVLNSLFQAARELSPEARKQYLDEVCGTDATMRKQLEDMLDAHHEHRTPTPQGPTQADPQYQPVNNAHLNLKPGDILENTYQIIEKISQGGMGAVYRAARVTDLKMEVAIKVIKPGLASPQTLARFNNEKQALAIMKHENISRVLDAGTTPSGLPFFVMELVKGVSITQFCDDNKLTVRERLELFVPVCEAIQHAHLKGVVHRDLKPSNILVALYDDKAVPKIIDFGLAKALHQPLTDDIVHTGFKTFVGTYQYAAPEQAQLNNLDIDTRADIYSLGVVLYELLTGAPTLSKERITNLVFDEVLRAIREEEPLRPSTKLGSSDKLPSLAALRRCEPVQLKQQIQGEIDWIVMKALEKERGRRFESANAFAADLRRYLAGEAVESGPASWSYRTGKYLKKHRGKVIAGGLLAAAILVGSVVSTIGWVTANRERARADGEAENANALNAFFINDVLSEADPYVHAKPGQVFIKQITVKTALDNAASKVANRFTGKPRIEANIRRSLGTIYQGIGDSNSAKIQLEKASELFHDLSGKASHDWLTTQYELSLVTMNQEKFELASSMLQGIITTLQNENSNDIRLLFKTQYLLALNLNYLGKAKESKQLFEHVYEQQKSRLGNNDLDTLVTQRELAVSQLDNGEIKRATKCLHETMQSIIKAFGEDHPQSLITQSAYASALDAEGQKIQAEQLISKVIERSKVVNGEQSPSTVKFKLQLAVNQANQAKWERASSMLEELIPQLKSHFGPFGFDTLGAVQSLGACLVMQRKYDKAESILLDCLSDCRRSLGERHPNTVIIVENIASMYERKNDVITHSIWIKILNNLSGNR